MATDPGGAGVLDVIILVDQGTSSLNISNNGTTWNAETGALTSGFNIAYGNGRFVMVSSGATSTAYSFDGTNFAGGGSLPSAVNWAVAYGNGTFVAVGQTGGCATSADSVSWTTQSNTPANFNSIMYAGGLFYGFTGASNTTIYSSTNGVSWTARTMPSTASWSNVCYGNGVWVALANGTAVSATSSNGTTWSAGGVPPGTSPVFSYKAMSFGLGIFVAMSANGVDTKSVYSTNGSSWTASTTGPGASYGSMVFDPGSGLFVTTKLATNLSTTPDGITWTTRSLGGAGANYYSGAAAYEIL